VAAIIAAARVAVRNVVDTLGEVGHHIADTVAAPLEWADQPATSPRQLSQMADPRAPAWWRPIWRAEENDLDSGGTSA